MSEKWNTTKSTSQETSIRVIYRMRSHATLDSMCIIFFHFSLLVLSALFLMLTRIFYDEEGEDMQVC